jgi:hypothetical protein
LVKEHVLNAENPGKTGTGMRLKHTLMALIYLKKKRVVSNMKSSESKSSKRTAVKEEYNTPS